MENKTKLESIVKELDHLEKDKLYRLLWSKYVKKILYPNWKVMIISPMKILILV